jgi:hypothetical protein
LLSFKVIAVAIISLDRDGLGQIARKVNVQALSNGQPVCNELQRNDVEKAL